MNSWDEYYKRNKPENIPWSGVSTEFFEEIWSKFKLPSEGNILDVGCGRGDKSLYFSGKGFSVWGVDVSTYAIKKAKLATKGTNPTFIAADITNLGEVGEIKGTTFDVVLDLSVSQFLSKDEKLKYLKGLGKNLKKDRTFYILLTFSKNDDFEEMEEWIRKIAQSSEDVQDTYGRHFNIIGNKRIMSKKGKAHVYVMKFK